MFRLNLARNKNTQGKYKGQINSARDTATNIRCDTELFNEYMNPESNLEWFPQAMQKNKLYPQHASIVGADGIKTVWRRFVGWVERNDWVGIVDRDLYGCSC